MKNTIIYSDLLLGDFTINDLIYYLQDILNNIEKEKNPKLNKTICLQIKFIIDVLNNQI